MVLKMNQSETQVRTEVQHEQWGGRRHERRSANRRAYIRRHNFADTIAPVWAWGTARPAYQNVTPEERYRQLDQAAAEMDEEAEELTSTNQPYKGSVTERERFNPRRQDLGNLEEHSTPLA